MALFGKSKNEQEDVRSTPPRDNTLLIVTQVGQVIPPETRQAIEDAALPLRTVVRDDSALSTSDLASCSAVLGLFPSKTTLDLLQQQVHQLREGRKDGSPVLILASTLEQGAALGHWLEAKAREGVLSGLRLIAATDINEVAPQLKGKGDPFLTPSVIKMPLSPELENTKYKYFYTISPALRDVVTLTQELSENGITRIYLLGGPGTGKTSFAYYYYLMRHAGNFVTINLTAESTDDKAAMKSLLCGHVVGAFPGAAAREGAFSFARDGVCFLDESHGVTGVVMQVLMEVLDSGQFLPFGATMKRPLECAVLFASNRSWESLRSGIHLDEHARLGATVIAIPDLARREEDLFAVLCSILARFELQCTSWSAPQGVTEDAWKRIRQCPWRGNMRTLIRVTESAAVSYAQNRRSGRLITEEDLLGALELWEPETHADIGLYSSF